MPILHSVLAICISRLHTVDPNAVASHVQKEDFHQDGTVNLWLAISPHLQLPVATNHPLPVSEERRFADLGSKEARHYITTS